MRSARPLVLLDTNAALLPFRTGVPLAAEVERLVPGAELAVPDAVRGELDRLVERGEPHAAAARALVGPLRTVRVDERGDRAVRAAALALGAPVVTADRLLARRLRTDGVTVIVPRDRARLELQPGAPAPPPSVRRERRPRPKR